MPIGAILAGAGALYGAVQGHQAGKKADKYADAALRQQQREYDERAPLRRQGMQALGQIEAPMDLGNLGFNASNPYAAARGPAPSTASYGDWGRMTFDAPAQPSIAEEDRAAQQAGMDKLAGSGIGVVSRFGQQGARQLRGVQPLAQPTYGWESQPAQSRTGVQPIGGRR